MQLSQIECLVSSPIFFCPSGIDRSIARILVSIQPSLPCCLLLFIVHIAWMVVGLSSSSRSLLAAAAVLTQYLLAGWLAFQAITREITHEDDLRTYVRKGYYIEWVKESRQTMGGLIQCQSFSVCSTGLCRKFPSRTSRIILKR